jgi:DNA-binding MarR family transcriptional regulator
LRKVIVDQFREGFMSDDNDEAFAFLLVQLGSHTARRFAETIAPSGLEPRHYGMLRRLAANEGQSQQALGALLGLNPTRMVFLVDDLEKHGFVERRRNPVDRRSYALYLTAAGGEALRRAEAATRHHAAGIGSTLSAADRRQLTRLLRRVAAEQGISEQSLPGPPPPGPGPDVQH